MQWPHNLLVCLPVIADLSGTSLPFVMYQWHAVAGVLLNEVSVAWGPLFTREEREECFDAYFLHRDSTEAALLGLTDLISTGSHAGSSASDLAFVDAVRLLARWVSSDGIKRLCNLHDSSSPDAAMLASNSALTRELVQRVCSIPERVSNRMQARADLRRGLEQALLGTPAGADFYLPARYFACVGRQVASCALTQIGPPESAGPALPVPMAMLWVHKLCTLGQARTVTCTEAWPEGLADESLMRFWSRCDLVACEKLLGAELSGAAAADSGPAAVAGTLCRLLGAAAPLALPHLRELLSSSFTTSRFPAAAGVYAGIVMFLGSLQHGGAAGAGAAGSMPRPPVMEVLSAAGEAWRHADRAVGSEYQSDRALACAIVAALRWARTADADTSPFHASMLEGRSRSGQVYVLCRPGWFALISSFHSRISLSPSVLSGVQARLGCSDVSRRHLGMLVAEEMSAAISPSSPLKFDEHDELLKIFPSDRVGVPPATAASSARSDAPPGDTSTGVAGARAQVSQASDATERPRKKSGPGKARVTRPMNDPDAVVDLGVADSDDEGAERQVRQEDTRRAIVPHVPKGMISN